MYLSYIHAEFPALKLVKVSIHNSETKIPHHLVYVTIYMLILYKHTAHKSIVSPEFFPIHVWSQMLAYPRHHTVATS